MSMSVCLSVCSYISKTSCPNFTQFSAGVNGGRGSILLWQQCNMLCTSGFTTAASIWIDDRLRARKPPHYFISHLGQLSFHSHREGKWVGLPRPKYDDALRLRSKDMHGSFHLWMHVWMTGKLCDPSLTHVIPVLERLSGEFFSIKRYTFLLFYMHVAERAYVGLYSKWLAREQNRGRSVLSTIALFFLVLNFLFYLAHYFQESIYLIICQARLDSLTNNLGWKFSCDNTFNTSMNRPFRLPQWSKGVSNFFSDYFWIYTQTREVTLSI